MAFEIVWRFIKLMAEYDSDLPLKVCVDFSFRYLAKRTNGLVIYIQDVTIFNSRNSYTFPRKLRLCIIFKVKQNVYIVRGD